MRVFIGIGLPHAISSALFGATERLLAMGAVQSAGIRQTPEQNVHITLSFLGQVDADRLELVKQTLRAIEAHRVSLQLAGIGTFAKAGILHVKVARSEALLKLAEQVFEAMERCGFAREPRQYTPHITLARAMRRLPLLASEAENDPAFQKAFEASAMNLYESRTVKEGLRYLLIESFPLAGSGIGQGAS